MKKILFILLTAFAFAACEGPEGPRGPQGPGTTWEIEFFTINKNQWTRYTGDGENEVYFRATRVPKIFNNLNSDERLFLYDEGSIQAYILFNYNTSTETQTMLPYIYNYSDDEFNSVVEVVYFDYTTEDIAFYVSYSGTDEEYTPDTMTFRVVMNW